MDVIELGGDTCETGEVIPVVPVGILALVDEGELDWKVFAVRASDPRAQAARSAVTEQVWRLKHGRVGAWLVLAAVERYSGRP